MIKTKIINFIPWAFIAVLIGMFLAQTFQLASLGREAQTLSCEVATLRAEQEYIQAQIEGHALSQERVDTMALTYTGRVFSIDKYRQWAKATYGGSAIPDWPHVCNGQPVYKENDKDTWVRGLDGEYRPCVPEWEAPAPAVCLRMQPA